MGQQCNNRESIHNSLIIESTILAQWWHFGVDSGYATNHYITLLILHLSQHPYF